MADGVVVEQGKPKDVLVHPKKDRTKEFLKRYLAQAAEMSGQAA